LLCLLFGWAGAHRFHLRRPKTAVAMALTLGGLGFWIWADAVRIATGSLRRAVPEPGAGGGFVEGVNDASDLFDESRLAYDFEENRSPSRSRSRPSRRSASCSSGSCGGAAAAP
jgi:hypothetical protein